MMLDNLDSVREYRLLVNGVWREALAKEVIKRGTLLLVSSYPFMHRPNLFGMQRAEILNRLADKMRENRDFLAKIEALEVGKNIRFARGDIDGAIGLVQFAAGMASNSVSNW